MRRIIPTLLLMLVAGANIRADEILVTSDMHHLRDHGPREWDEFPRQATLTRLVKTFVAQANDQAATLLWRQQDVKQTWRVILNGKRLADLAQDENDMIVAVDVPPGSLQDGDNELVIEQIGQRKEVDDIRIGEIRLDSRRRPEVLSAAKLVVSVRDAQTGAALPARLTIVDERGSLVSTSAVSHRTLAVRPGILYTANGRAEFGVPAGRYRLYAGRGFEYSLAQAEIELLPGQTRTIDMTIKREVPTPGWIACDTHIHTRTHSGHGDATVEERMITLAAEGIELPIATDHNVQIDHAPYAKELGMTEYFTPVIGNEVTTKIGHFNIFPVQPGARTPPHDQQDWEAI
ncbi:MAG: hypothetical protein KDA71_24725, partial [Planctomycetales bacterium]|nr:hypothetical protein [Planctomycetales bacterium]